ncbi:phosphate acyltransferase PlsX [Oceanicella actignis]|uniref:phosphate acyltransferase PlsX n=1 Tax=Oceanicella actignis TaxID=1189325 RepID=UPI0011E774EA|nr:phosphate acyltransferase PlsX [Oceanicella actignis]TYO91577.1 phosphate:acyl-[acyl carrier protein] acyltransferase [Oceanicella actignis]
MIETDEAQRASSRAAGAAAPEGAERPPAVISIDAMGGDRGPAAVVAGMAKAARHDPDLRFIVHGDEAELRRLLRRRSGLAARVELRHAEGEVSMDDKPSRVMRNARGTSMLGAIDAVARDEAGAAVSCGNTGALIALSVLRLRRAPGVDRPAIAVFWPSRNPAGYNIVLDVGADIRADPHNLLQYAVMGAEYARLGLRLDKPRVGLLNVGSEAHKGGAERGQASALIGARAAEPGAGFDYVGFVEGGDILSDRVDVIVTDGFTGNIALKTAEGTASLINELLRAAFAHSPLSRLGALAAYTSLQRLRKRIDPRRVNGGVFLGLNGAVVKSHGGADATGFAAAIRLAARMARTGFPQRVAQQVAKALRAPETAAAESSQSRGGET